MIKVGVIGHTGRLGKPLVEILNKHPYAEIVYTHSTSEPSKITLLESKAELLISALEMGVSKEYEHEWQDIRVIDLSIDHRLDDEWVYGLPELNKDKIKGARKVANPGCYATSIILGLAPLKEKVRDVNISSTSGISGAGMEVQQKDNSEVYKDKEGREHEQIPEIERMLGLEEILFVPQRDYTVERGIVSKIFGKYIGSEDILELYHEFYKKMPFVRVREDIATKNVNITNFCDIKVSKFKDRIIIISALDNLIKGGSGQAVQNMNLMYGFDERTGLL